MATVVETRGRLSEELVEFLQGPQLVLVTTLDAETAWPTNNLITWVMAKDPETVRLVTETNGRVMKNMEADDRVLLTIFTRGACHAVEGNARMIARELEGVELKLCCAEVKVRAVRDVTFFGGNVTAEPRYEVTYDQDRKQRLDTSVFMAMRQL